MGEINIPCLKWLLYVFHLVVLIVGSALVVIGSLYITIFKHDFHFATLSVHLASLVFIGTGAFLILLAAFGVFATRSTNRYFVIGHIAGLVIAFAVLAYLGIWGLLITYNGKLSAEVNQSLLNSIEAYNETDTENSETIEINWLQTRFQCCGASGINDWKNKTFDESDTELSESDAADYTNNNRSTFSVPDTCCINVNATCGKQYPALDTLNQNGCFDGLNEFLLSDMKIICGLSSILAGLTLLAISFMVYVYLRVRGDYSQLNQNA